MGISLTHIFTRRRYFPAASILRLTHDQFFSTTGCERAYNRLGRDGSGTYGHENDIN